jgi:hypothetical protein
MLYNCGVPVIEKSIHVVFDEFNTFYLQKELEVGVDVMKHNKTPLERMIKGKKNLK